MVYTYSYIHTQNEYYSTIRRDKIMKLATTRMGLEGIMLNDEQLQLEGERQTHDLIYIEHKEIQ